MARNFYFAPVRSGSVLPGIARGIESGVANFTAGRERKRQQRIEEEDRARRDLLTDIELFQSGVRKGQPMKVAMPMNTPPLAPQLMQRGQGAPFNAMQYVPDQRYTNVAGDYFALNPEVLRAEEQALRGRVADALASARGGDASTYLTALEAGVTPEAVTPYDQLPSTRAARELAEARRVENEAARDERGKLAEAEARLRERLARIAADSRSTGSPREPLSLDELRDQAIWEAQLEVAQQAALAGNRGPLDELIRAEKMRRTPPEFVGPPAPTAAQRDRQPGTTPTPTPTPASQRDRQPGTTPTPTPTPASQPAATMSPETEEKVRGVVTQLREQGLSRDKIKERLKAVGYTEDEIRKLLKPPPTTRPFIPAGPGGMPGAFSRVIR